jgi:DivIVA domain-containing protein
MDSPKSSSQQSSLDSLRTVEFRQTLRGYHIDDVDEYLERVAIEAEAMQEQMRQAADRTRQAAERIAHLEQAAQQLQQQLEVAQAQPAAVAAPVPAVADDSLQRTLLLAQKFVDQTEAEAEAQARSTVAEAEARAKALLTEAENRARAVTEETERHLRDDISRLETMRTQLAGDVETIARHLETERNRLRSALGDMLTWVDEHVQPAASLLAQPPSAPDSAAPSSGADKAPPRPVPEGEGRVGEAGAPVRPPTTGAFPPGGPAPGTVRHTAEDVLSSGDRQGTMPLAEPEGARAGVPH